MLLSLRKNGLTSLFKEVRVFKVRKFAAKERQTHLVGACLATGDRISRDTICPKTITLQHLIFGQLILGAVT